MKNIIYYTLGAAALSLLSACQQKVVVLDVPADASNRELYAASKLSEELIQQGYTIKKPSEAGSEDHVIRLEIASQDRLNALSDSAFARNKEGYTIVTHGNITTVVGNDGSGVIYGCRELMDRMSDQGALIFPDSISDAPEMVLRGGCIGVQKPYLLPGRSVYEYPYTEELFPWFYDKSLWIKYLDMLVENRMNSIYLWNGHPFASLVKLEDYPFAIEVDDETFKKNEEMYTFITEEADKRGIFVIQMFYNILVSKPFADHYNIKTQDRNRPITPLVSDYTRKSVAAFIEKYPNVGLLVCLGEAMSTYEDDVEWFTQTIIPGVKDGLKKLGRTDEPPILLRAHDTDCKMVMDAALPIYKNLYTMHKYNGESLTTYEPRGPWADIHKSLSSLGSIHISNVHILANLEPFRWGSPAFTQKAVKAMHNVHGANALHLYPQASYWDWPYSADSLSNGDKLLEIDRDWIWYKNWGRYAWNCHRDTIDEQRYWDGQLASYYGLTQEQANNIRIAYDESGEIAPKLLRRFGITEGNRQSLLLGMFASQLVNPYKYTIYPGFYESCGPEGEKLIEYVEKEWKQEAHVGEMPLDIVKQCIAHADKAVAAIDAVKGKATIHNDELVRLANDMHCYQAFAYSFYYKVLAAREVLNYKWTKRIDYLDQAIPLLEQSLDYYKKLVDLTQGTYRYANSMQTSQRRIPIQGDNGKNKTWKEMLPHYEAELLNLKTNTERLKLKEAGKLDVSEESLNRASNAHILLNGNWKRAILKPGAVLLSNKPECTISKLAPELEGLNAFVFDGEKCRTESATLDFECKAPTQLLVGFFKDDHHRYAQAPKLETDATANEYGQAEPLLVHAVLLKDQPLVNVHAYHFEAGKHSLTLPKGYLLVLGFTDSDIKPRNVALDGTSEEVDWLFY